MQGEVRGRPRQGKAKEKDKGRGKGLGNQDQIRRDQGTDLAYSPMERTIMVNEKTITVKEL